jgi:hypothetical protein
LPFFTGSLFVIASDAVFLNSDIRTSLLFMHQRHSPQELAALQETAQSFLL